MNDRMKFCIAVLGIAALGVLGAGCGSSDDNGSGGSGNSGDEVNIAYSGFAASNSFSQETFRGIEQVAEENNANATFLDANFDSAKQIADIQDAVTSGRYDALILNANDPNGIVPPLEEAIDAGLVVVASFVPIGPDLTTLEPQVDGLTATVGQTPLSTGEQTGELIVQACEGIDECKVAYLPGSKSLPLETVRTDGAMSVIEQHDNIELVSDQEGGYTADEGLQTTQNVLQANPDIDVIASSDQAIAGAARAVDSAGLNGQVKLIGQGASKQAIDWIRNGDWFGAYVYMPYTEGRKSAEIAIDAVRGEEVEPVVDTESLSPVGPTVTEENLGDFKGDWTS